MEINRSQIDYNFSDLVLTILGIVLAIIFGLVPLYQWLYKKYIQRALFTFELNKNGTLSIPRGDFQPVDPFQNPIFDTRNSPQTFTYEWKFRLIITNNSIYDAFLPQLEYIGGLANLSTAEKPNIHKPIGNRENIDLQIIYSEKEVVSALQRKNMNEIPEAIEKLKVLLSFQNAYGKHRFYALYDNETKEVKTSFFRPKLK